MNRTSLWTALVAIPLSLFPIPHLSAQKRAITFDDLIALKTVNDPQLSPNGKWVAYAVTTNSLQDNRGVARIWLAEVATGQSRQVTQGPGSDRSPRWSPDGQTLAFLSTRQNGSQIWVLSLAGGEARRVSSLPDGVGELYWLPDGRGGGPLAGGGPQGPPAQGTRTGTGACPTNPRHGAGPWRCPGLAGPAGPTKP